MHRAFQLNEIVSLVATQVAATKCPDVVKLARTCRTLATPCLDVLWSTYQHEFLPLIMCLPRDCFVLDDDGFESLYYFKRAPEPHEWARVDRYARVMRDLEIKRAWPNDLAFSAWSTLCDLRPDHVLLPNLRTLNWNTDDISLKHISLLNSPNLVKVTVRLTGAEDPQLVAELPFHHVEELHLVAPDPAYFQPLGVEFNDAVSELAMRTTPRLQNIRVPTILSSNAFHHIADLPNIERIDAQFCLDLDRPYLYEPLNIPSLKTFKARFQGTDAWKFALPRIHTPNLSGMTLKFKENPNESECRELLDIMVNDGLDKKVSRLSIPRIDAMTGVVLQVLEPLFQFKNLTNVRLGFHCDDPKGCMYMMTDPDAAAIGKALPNLQKLFLGPACKIPNRGVTFKGLASLSEHCRDLEKLQTHFDLTYNNVDELNQRLTEAVAPGTSECKLKEICVGRQGYSSSPDAPLTLALTLDRMFPQLKRVNHSYSEQSWRKVQGVLENIRAFQSSYSQVQNAMQGITSPTSSKELSNSQLPAHIRRDPISMAFACYTNGTDLSGMRVEERQPFWNEVANAHSLIQKFQPMSVGGFQNDVPMEIC
ncbi:hypothetical protein BDM02DRAFT_3189923 [Thelephora ganbajun]|uniref:Uncharacterized protein n=1 Tax=Thelephora ganbajun TaxID=370292 RepID=A0ACB6Z6F7_THEGA|nr:hypothetical protein BDM02DRAFT_3189923 [Thelephora ganbajun]